MKYKCPECKSAELTEIVEYTIEFDLKTGVELRREPIGASPPKYECRNCKDLLSHGELLREYDDNEK